MYKKVFLIRFMIFFTLASCDTKVWMFDTQIDNPKNWAGGKTEESCNGLVFSTYSHLPVFIKNLKIKQIVLPKYGSINFEEGSSILFDEESTDILNCVQLNAIKAMYWFNTTLWKNLDNPDNPAVPLRERLPCKYDDVVLPKGYNSSIAFFDTEIPVKSVTFGNEKVTQKQLNNLLTTDAGQEAFPVIFAKSQNKEVLKIKGDECKDPTGCDRTLWSRRSHLVYAKEEKIQCTEGIAILGNARQKICGGQIVINTTKTGFTIERINRKLKEYKSYTHASKYEYEKQIQIIFAEKEFTGLSLVEATEFYNILLEDDSYFCKDITLQTSGPPLYEKSDRVKNALSIVFGTLFGVVVMFGLLFLVYSPNVGNLNLRNRLLSTRPLSTYILHYDNMEDRANIIDGQSMAGSVAALNRAFANPMYEHGSSSTRSTSKETVISSKFEEDEEQATSEKAAILDSAKELEDIDLHNIEESEKDEVLLKDL